MDIGTSDKRHVRVWDDEGSRLLVEDTEMCTYTLYQVVDTVMHPKPEVAEKCAQEPYTFDALTGVMRIYQRIGECEVGDEPLERLLAGAPEV